MNEYYKQKINLFIGMAPYTKLDSDSMMGKDIGKLISYNEKMLKKFNNF